MSEHRGSELGFRDSPVEGGVPNMLKAPVEAKTCLLPLANQYTSFTCFRAALLNFTESKIFIFEGISL